MVTGKTPLSYAARGGFLEAVKLLGERGDVEMNPVGGEPLVLAASHGHSEAVEYLTGKPGVRVNVAIHDQTAIYHACEKGFRGIFDILTSRSDTIVVKEYQQGIDLLSVAAKGVSNLSARAYIMATLLDKYGMDPNSRDDSGFTPLMHAVLHGDVSTVRFLLDRGAEVDSRSRDGATPLMLAAARVRLGITKVLIARGKADTSARDNAGKTALFYAAEGSFGQSTSLAFAQDQAAPIELLRFLLSCEGVSPCTLDYSGKSASFYATSLGSSAEKMLNPAMEKEPLQWFS
jgi:ankyrin repeat protein